MHLLGFWNRNSAYLMLEVFSRTYFVIGNKMLEHVFYRRECSQKAQIMELGMGIASPANGEISLKIPFLVTF